HVTRVHMCAHPIYGSRDTGRRRTYRLLQPAHGLDFVHYTLAAELDTGVGHLCRGNRVVARNRAGIHHAREAKMFAATIDGDLLVACDLQIAVGQHPHHGGGEGAGEEVVGTCRTFALHRVATGHVEILIGTDVTRQYRRHGTPAQGGTTGAFCGGGHTLLRVGAFLNHHGNDISHIARPPVFEQRVIAIGRGLVNRTIRLGRRHGVGGWRLVRERPV